MIATDDVTVCVPPHVDNCAAATTGTHDITAATDDVAAGESTGATATGTSAACDAMGTHDTTVERVNDDTIGATDTEGDSCCDV